MKADRPRDLPGKTRLWVLVQHREGRVEEASLGLLGEARAILDASGNEGSITAVALGFGPLEALKSLGAYGAHRVFYIDDPGVSSYHGERLAARLFDLAQRERPACILAAHTPETADLCPRLAALLQAGLVTGAVDFTLEPGGGARALRPVSNGYLFEELRIAQEEGRPVMVSFVPAVLTAPEPDQGMEARFSRLYPEEIEDALRTELLETVRTDPGAMGLEESDVVVAGGRGAGKGEAFAVIHELAAAVGGTVGGTRPVVDGQVLPFERQIGQTGKTVAPRLIFACGISGANEFTAGMEKAQYVVAVNKDPRARIFRFADLGVVGDLHAILPELIARIRALTGRGKR